MSLIAPHITAFLQQRLLIERRASGNTCDSYAYAFKLLFEYASGYLKTTPSQLHLEQIDAQLVVKFLNHLETTRRNGASSRNVRLAAIKSFMRFSELIGIRMDDLKLQPQATVLIHGKGRKQRCLPLWKETTSVLRAWLTIRGHASAPELFLNARGEPMTRSGFEYILRKHVHTAAKRCPALSSKRVSPHWLRHYVPFPTMSRDRESESSSMWNCSQESE